MKKIPFLTQKAAPAVALALLLAGCKKDESAVTLTPEQEVQATFVTAQSESESDLVFDDVFNSVVGANAEIGMEGPGVYGRVDGNTGTLRQDSSRSSCAKWTVSPTQPNAFPKTVVIDFGSGCEIKGRVRSGKIITVYTGRLSDPGASATTSFENYSIDSITVAGTHKITNTTSGTNNMRQFTVEVKNARLGHIRNTAHVAEWNATRVHTQIEGNGSNAPADDVFRTTGRGAGTVKHHNVAISWNSEITEPLIKRFTCRWLSKGILKTTRTNLPANSKWVGMLNFGDGTCDNKATLIVNGVERQIVLR